MTHCVGAIFIEQKIFIYRLYMIYIGIFTACMGNTFVFSTQNNVKCGIMYIVANGVNSYLADVYILLSWCNDFSAPA